ncbi:hypothetical protein ACI65C_006278, partial [Semiaphis heraclei]
MSDFEDNDLRDRTPEKTKRSRNEDIGRTKATAITKNVIGKCYHEDLAGKLMKYKFSVIIDESTDVGTVKNMAIYVKYYNLENNKLETKFWELVQLFTDPESAKKGATADILYNTLLNSFIENEIPMDNIIGFAADGCNTMFGEHNSVSAKLKEQFPDLYLYEENGEKLFPNLAEFVLNVLSLPQLNCVCERLFSKRDTKCLRRFREGEKSKSRQGFVIERQARMLTGGGPETTSYLDTTPEVNEIIQPRIDPQIVENQNIYDGDGIEFTTEELSPLNISVVYLSDSINDNPGEYVVRTSTETNFSTYRIVNFDQNVNSENCYKETDQILQFSSPRPHKSTVENDPLHNGSYFINTYWVCHHAAKNKTTKSKRDVTCQASLDILLKKNNKNTKKKNDEYLKREPPLCAIIKLKLNHNHPINSCGALKLLRVPIETQEVFLSYFDDWLTASEAIHLDESKLIVQENSCFLLANASINPTKRQAYYLHDEWRKKDYGSVHEPLIKLKEKIESYKNLGVTISIQGEATWAVLIVTPIMERAHKLKCSQEIIFLDSTSSVDTTSNSITVILTPSKAGAIPLAILIHNGESEENYTNAFNLLKNKFPLCFGGNSAPMVFMSDDSSAEKNSLHSVWPSAKQFLCHFHMAQAEWRWLHDTKNGIQLDDRCPLMRLFQKVMYADNMNDLENSITEIRNVSTKFNNFVQRFERNFNRKEEWIKLYRLHILYRNHETNNYAEASIRVVKYILLSRTKAYNVVALVDFIVNV